MDNDDNILNLKEETRLISKNEIELYAKLVNALGEYNDIEGIKIENININAKRFNIEKNVDNLVICCNDGRILVMNIKFEQRLIWICNCSHRVYIEYQLTDHNKLRMKSEISIDDERNYSHFTKLTSKRLNETIKTEYICGSECGIDIKDKIYLYKFTEEELEYLLKVLIIELNNRREHNSELEYEMAEYYNGLPYEKQKALEKVIKYKRQ